MFLETIAAISNVVLAFSAAVGAFAAIVGLNTWKKQATFERDSDLSRRVLHALFVLRNEIQTSRLMTEHGRLRRMMKGRMGERYNVLPEQEILQTGFEIDVSIFEHFEGAIDDAFIKVEALAVEADANWESKFSGLLVPLRLLRHELSSLRLCKLGTIDPSASIQSVDADVLRLKGMRDVEFRDVFEIDEFTKELEAAISVCESFLRTKMGQVSR